MAKGRKFESSHHDRLLSDFGGYTSDQPSSPDRSELAEEDVWSTINGENEHDHDHDGDVARMARASLRCRANGKPVERRWAREEDRQAGGLSLAFEAGGKASPRVVHQNHPATAGGPSRRQHAAESDPVNVPDWPKILRADSTESMHDGYGDDNEEWIPPHEYLARSRRSGADLGTTGSGEDDLRTAAAGAGEDDLRTTGAGEDDLRTTGSGEDDLRADGCCWSCGWLLLGKEKEGRVGYLRLREGF